ncbi:MAG: NAD-binding protein, partial [Oscillospiraceae bacterium]
MKIIIVGMGQTGTLLASRLSCENHDVTIVDSDRARVEAVTDKYSVSGVCGSGASQSVLLQAGADTADVVISLLPSDEANLMTCMTAKNIGTRYAALRLKSPEFGSDKEYLQKQFGIDYIVNPMRDTANEIIRQIGLPGLAKADAFFSADVVLLRIDIEQGNPLIGRKLLESRGIFDTEMLIGAVKRGNEVFIPNGSFVIESGDTVNIILPYSGVSKLFTALGMLRKPVKSVFIVGGGATGLYLAERLISDGKRVTILECDKKRCKELSELLPKATVSYVEEIDSDILTEEGIGKADVCV